MVTRCWSSRSPARRGPTSEPVSYSQGTGSGFGDVVTGQWVLNMVSGCAMTVSLDTIGIIAGNRSLPMVFARQARQLGVKRLVAVAFHGETDPALAELVDEIEWLKVGQLEADFRLYPAQHPALRDGRPDCPPEAL